MSKEQLEKDLCQNGFCSTERRAHCRLSANSYCWDVEIIAEKLYNADYRKQSGWISVEERLPTECENVLCFEDGKAYVAFLEKAEYSAIWWDWVDYDRDDTWTERKPTHWMPLPEAPKMKGGED